MQMNQISKLDDKLCHQQSLPRKRAWDRKMFGVENGSASGSWKLPTGEQKFRYVNQIKGLIIAKCFLHIVFLTQNNLSN